MQIQTIELDPNKVYSIMVEVGDLNYDETKKYLQDVKSLYEKHNIKAIYSGMNNGVPTVTINEILPSIKKWYCE